MQVADINGVPTHVFSLKSRARNSSLLLVVPGSPGMGHFYIPFATRLFHLGDGAYDVSVVSHAGHSPGFYRSADAEGRDWYSLEDQIAHKMAYIEQQAAEKECIYLVGHSIGCYVILHLLKQLAPSRVKKVVFLFPTIERMADTPNALRLWPLFTTLKYPFTAIVGILSWFPHSFKWLVLRQYFYYFRSLPQDHIDHMAQAAINIDGKSIYNILCMAYQEMQEVSEAPEDVIQEHIDKLVFYYGVGDRWNLEDCYREMTEKFPEKDVNLCQKGYSHAFVFDASYEMAELVYSRIPKDGSS